MMRKGFTLIELLMVMLVIAILAAIAWPQYQLAIDESRWSTMLPGAKSLKEAQERMWMQSSAYANSTDLLDISMPGTRTDNQVVSAGITYTLSNTNDGNVVITTHEKMPDIILEMYLNQSRNFPGEVHCKAITASTRATRLCEQLVGTNIGTKGDYTVYVLEGSGHGTL